LTPVKARLTVFSENDVVLDLVRDFASGLGCAVDRARTSGEGLRIDLPETDDGLLELLDYVALSATRAGVHVGEPLCRIDYQRGGARAQVTLELRIAQLRIAGTTS
jgi:hypothetical protein